MPAMPIANRGSAGRRRTRACYHRRARRPAGSYVDSPGPVWSNRGFGQSARAAILRGGRPVEAVIISGGKQYRVREGDVVRLERLATGQGDTVEFREVAYLRAEGDPVVDPAGLGTARVLGQVVQVGRGRKLIVGKFKRRKNYRRRQGHRQAYTAVRITRIEAGA